MRRHLVLFAREPGREAREKGFRGSDAAQLFASLAEGWRDAARRTGARLVVVGPPEDRLAWGRWLGRDFLWISQAGADFGRRLENAARTTAGLGGRAVLVGGDVVPSPRVLAAAFSALDCGADAVLAPAPDGGVSLVALPAADFDLLRSIACRRRDVFATLHGRLLSRLRSVELVGLIPDVDGRGSLRRGLLSRMSLPSLRRVARSALVRIWPRDGGSVSFVLQASAGPSGLRAPPASA